MNNRNKIIIISTITIVISLIIILTIPKNNSSIINPSPNIINYDQSNTINKDGKDSVNNENKKVEVNLWEIKDKISNNTDKQYINNINPSTLKINNDNINNEPSVSEKIMDVNTKEVLTNTSSLDINTNNPNNISIDATNDKNNELFIEPSKNSQDNLSKEDKIDLNNLLKEKSTEQ